MIIVSFSIRLYPDQLAQLRQQQPAYTVGSLINWIKVDSLVAVIHELLATDHPEQRLAQLTDTLAQQFALIPSKKHLAGRDLGRLEPTPALKYKAAA